MSDFKKAIQTIIVTHEGGFQNDKTDAGNYTPDGELKGTKYGISAHSFPYVDIENLTLNGAEDLYRQTWGMFGALEDQRVLTKVLDLAVNMQWAGHGPASKILQLSCNQLSFQLNVDGVFGPATAAAANACDPAALIKEICVFAANYYLEVEANNPTKKVWFGNWNARAGWVPSDEQDV